MEEILKVAFKLGEAGPVIILTTLLVGALFAIRQLFDWGNKCQEARIKESDRLIRCIETNTIAHQEATRATEADVELQKANRILLEQNTQLLHTIAFQGRGRRE